MPPSAYNRGVHEALVSAERVGLSRRACAGHAGINWRTYLRWLEKGAIAAAARDEGLEVLAEYVEYEQLFRDVEHMRAVWEQERLETMNDDEQKANMWQREAWQLERKLPDEYSLTTTVRHQGEIEHKHTQELPEAVQRKMLEAFDEMARPKELEPSGEA